MHPIVTIDSITIRQDVEGRYCINDLHKAAIASGANARTKEPAKFLASPQTQELIAELTDTQILGIAPVNATKGGIEQGTFVCRELVYSYAMWISPSFHLKVIRAYDAMASARYTPPTTPESSGLHFTAEWVCKMLNLQGSAKLGVVRRVVETAAPVLLPQIPVYAIDAPDGYLTGGSSLPTKSATELLKQFDVKVSAIEFNRALVAAGFLEELERKSSNGKTKTFKSVTESGLQYGKNVTSPTNPRETQPHWYVDTFTELLEDLGYGG